MQATALLLHSFQSISGTEGGTDSVDRKPAKPDGSRTGDEINSRTPTVVFAVSKRTSTLLQAC